MPTVVAQFTCCKRPTSLTLYGARIFKQRLPPHGNTVSGSQEPGARSQEPEFSEQNDFPTFSEIILLLLYADK